MVLAMSDKDRRVWGRQAVLFSSTDESDLWRPEPPVCPPEALETLFTTDTNSGPEEMAWPWKFHFLSAFCS